MRRCWPVAIVDRQEGDVVSEHESPDGLSAAESDRRPGICRVAGQLVGAAGGVRRFIVQCRSAVAAGDRDGCGTVSGRARCRSAAGGGRRPGALSQCGADSGGRGRLRGRGLGCGGLVGAVRRPIPGANGRSRRRPALGTYTRPFWTAALGYEVSGDVDPIDPLRRGPQLSFQPIRQDRAGRGRTHVDVSVPADLARAGSTPRSPPVARSGTTPTRRPGGPSPHRTTRHRHRRLDRHLRIAGTIGLRRAH